VLQAAARGVQNQAGAKTPADISNPLVKVGRYARRQAAACHDEFGRLRCQAQLVEALLLF
jgi:hypothetical protein